MTGCPQQHIYSSSHTFDRVRVQGRVRSLPDRPAVHLDEIEGDPVRPHPTDCLVRIFPCQRFSPVKLPIRVDFLFGLVRPAPNVPHLEVLDQLGPELQTFVLPALTPGGVDQAVSGSSSRPDLPLGLRSVPLGRTHVANRAVDPAQGVPTRDQHHA